MWWFSKVMIVIFVFALNFQPTFNSVALAEGNPENRTVAEQLKEVESQKNANSENGEPSQIESEMNNEELPLELQSETNWFWTFLKLIGALGFVILIMFVLLRLFTSRSRSFRTNKTIENIGGVALGANRSVQIIRVGERILIVGVGENVQLLKEIEKGEEVERVLERHEQELERLDVPITKFSNWLKGKTANQKKESGKREVEFGTLLKQQLNDVSESQKKVHEAMKEQK